MELLALRNVEASARDRVFRYSPLRAGLFWSGSAAMAGASAYVGWVQYGRSGFVAWYLAAVLFTGVVLTRRFFVARLRRSNWLVRMNDTGLLVQFRSYLNYDLPADDPTVAAISFADIRSARLVRERTTIESQDGPTRQFRQVVELELSGDVRPLIKALDAELATKIPRVKTWYGSGGTLYRHYPVRMTKPPVLQLEWGVVPAAGRFLDALRPYTSVRAAAVASEDFTADGLDREVQERRVRELVRRGETIAATELARHTYGLDLTAARAFIERL